jgi:hypothetical protein
MGSSATHGVDESASLSLKPLGHGVHKLAPAGEKLPTSQLVHAASSEPLYVPPAQGTHGVVASPSSSAKPPPHTYSVVDPVGGAGGGVSHSSTGVSQYKLISALGAHATPWNAARSSCRVEQSPE